MLRALYSAYSRRSSTVVNVVAPVLASPFYVGGTGSVTPGTWTGSPVLTYSLTIDGVEKAAGELVDVEAYVAILGNRALDAIVYEIPNGDTGLQVASNTVVVYDPSNESTGTACYLDLFADYGTTVTGQGVSSFIDRITAYDFTQATDANRPPLLADWNNGRAALDPDGVSDRVNHTFTTDQFQGPNQNTTVYFVGGIDTMSGTLDNSVIDFGADRLYLYLNGFTNNAGWFSGPDGFIETGAPSLGKHHWCWALEHGVASHVYQDRVSLGTAVYLGTGVGGSTYVASIDTGGFYLDGQIARILVFSGLHDAATRARVWSWIEFYYGL